MAAACAAFLAHFALGLIASRAADVLLVVAFVGAAIGAGSFSVGATVPDTTPASPVAG